MFVCFRYGFLVAGIAAAGGEAKPGLLAVKERTGFAWLAMGGC